VGIDSGITAILQSAYSTGLKKKPVPEKILAKGVLSSARSRFHLSASYLKGVSSYICISIGNRKSLQKGGVEETLSKANGFMNAVGIQFALNLASHRE